VDRGDEILNAQEVAIMLKMSRRMVYALHASGELVPSHQLPTASRVSARSREGWRWTRTEVENFLHKYRYRPTASPSRNAYVSEFVPVELPTRGNVE